MMIRPGLIKPAPSQSLGNDAYTVALLHFNASMADAAIGGSAKTWTANGNAQISAAAPKLGAGSLLLDGAGDWVETPASADFNMGSGDWTIDLWLKTTGTGRMWAAGQVDSSGGTVLSQCAIVVEKTSAQKAALGVCVGASFSFITGTTNINTGNWVHVAGDCSGGVARLYVNGVEEGTPLTLGGSVNSTSTKFSIGRGGEYNGLYWTGSIDEVRVSKGVARWSGNFTPPIAEYA